MESHAQSQRCKNRPQPEKVDQMGKGKKAQEKSSFDERETRKGWLGGLEKD